MELLCPWNFPGKKTGVGCHFQLQGIFPTQGLNLCLLCLLSWQANSFIISATWEAPNFSCLSTKYKFYFITTYSRVFSNKYFKGIWGCLYFFLFILLKGPSSQSYGFSRSHVWMWELDHKEGWVPKNWCFWTAVLEKTLDSPLDGKEIQPVYPKGNQSWILIGRTGA